MRLLGPAVPCPGEELAPADDGTTDLGREIHVEGVPGGGATAPLLHQGLQDVDALLARPQPRFHRYGRIEPSANVGALIDEIDYDPTGIFCG